MRVKEIMKHDVRTISPERPLSEAADQMRVRGIRHLIVMKRSAIAGVLSYRDLAGISMRELDQVQVGDVASERVITIGPDATVAQAANRMRGNRIGCLPVVEGGKLLGIVTTTDLLELVGRAGRPERLTLRDHAPRRRPAHS